MLTYKELCFTSWEMSPQFTGALMSEYDSINNLKSVFDVPKIEAADFTAMYCSLAY